MKLRQAVNKVLEEHQFLVPDVMDRQTLLDALVEQLSQQGSPRSKKCTACNGSGRYDNHGSPKCGACKGTGREKVG